MKLPTPSRSPEYRAWENMRARCAGRCDPITAAAYAERGIKVCERWRVFENFLADVGKRPGAAYTLERIDNDGGYTRRNVRWATRAEQSNNRRPRSVWKRWAVRATRGTKALAEYLGREGLTAAELARRIGTDDALVSRWLHGLRTPDIRHAFAIQEVTGLDPRIWI